MPKVVYLKDAEPFKLYRYAKPAKSAERDILVMPVGEKYSQHSMYFIEIHAYHYIEVLAYGNRIELIEADKKAKDINFPQRLIRSIFDKKIAGEAVSAKNTRIFSNAAVEFLKNGDLI